MRSPGEGSDERPDETPSPESSPGGEARRPRAARRAPAARVGADARQSQGKARKASDSLRFPGLGGGNRPMRLAPSLRIKLLCASFHVRRSPRNPERGPILGRTWPCNENCRGWLDNACFHRVRRGSAFGGLQFRGCEPDGGPDRGNGFAVAGFRHGWGCFPHDIPEVFQFSGRILRRHFLGACRESDCSQRPPFCGMRRAANGPTRAWHGSFYSAGRGG